MPASARSTTPSIRAMMIAMKVMAGIDERFARCGGSTDNWDRSVAFDPDQLRDPRAMPIDLLPNAGAPSPLPSQPARCLGSVVYRPGLFFLGGRGAPYSAKFGGGDRARGLMASRTNRVQSSQTKSSLTVP